MQKMIELGKTGAYIICIDANREFECDGLYVDGMDYAELCKHDGLEKNGRQSLLSREEIMPLLSELPILCKNWACRKLE